MACPMYYGQLSQNLQKATPMSKLHSLSRLLPLPLENQQLSPLRLRLFFFFLNFILMFNFIFHLIHSSLPLTPISPPPGQTLFTLPKGLRFPREVNKVCHFKLGQGQYPFPCIKTEHGMPPLGVASSKLTHAPRIGPGASQKVQATPLSPTHGGPSLGSGRLYSCWSRVQVFPGAWFNCLCRLLNHDLYHPYS